VQIALRLVRESDSISRSSDSFCLNASRIAPSSACEFEAGFGPHPFMLSLMFLMLPSVYQTPIPAVAFSQPLLTANLSVLILVYHPLGSIAWFILGGFLSLRNGSFSLNLWPGIFPRILIPPSVQWSGLVSGLNSTEVFAGSFPLFLLIPLGVCHRSCLWGVEWFGFHLSSIRCINSRAFCLQSVLRGLQLVQLAIGICSAFVVSLVRSLIDFTLWFSCKHRITLEFVLRCLFLAKGWKAGISSLRFVGTLIRDIVALYFCAASIISFVDLVSFSDLILTGHIW